VLDTACSSSLVAVRLAAQATARGEAKDAHAAGTQCMLLSSTFRILSDLNALSSDGRCKTLDASADGYGRGEGFASIYVRNMLASSEHDRMIKETALLNQL
jgi:acyl transferase domain-containing protein